MADKIGKGSTPKNFSGSKSLAGSRAKLQTSKRQTSLLDYAQPQKTSNKEEPAERTLVSFPWASP